ncbi:cache domain-containing protein [Candidatus Bipolaricaulota bacterium]|nr:cache domain-containing protein [Candidatus Bipolaricaulota bacterium]
MPSNRRGHRRATRTFAGIALLGAACLTYAVIDHVSNPQLLLIEACATAQATTKWIADNLVRQLLEIEGQVHGIAEQLHTGALSRGNIGAACIEQLLKSPGLYGLCPAFEPLEGPERDLFDPYWRRAGHEIIMLDSDDESSDYSIPDPGPIPGARRTHWYHVPMLLERAWVEPYFCLDGETLMVTYGERLLLPGGRAAVMVGDLSLDWLREALSGYPVGRTGYALILSEGQRFIAHPNRRLLGRSMDEVLASPELASASELDVLRWIDANLDEALRDGGALDAGRNRELHATRIDPPGWLLVTVFVPNEVVPTTDAERRSRTAILLATFPLLIGLLGWSVPRRLGAAKVRLIVCALSLMLIVGIGLQWRWSLEFPARQDEADFPVYDDGMTNAVLARLLPSGPPSDVTPAYLHSDWESSERIATGIFIQSARFLGPYNVAVTGYVWQRGGNTERPGVVFPEAEEFTLDHVASEADVDRWYFTADLRQSFDYKTYPVDREQIWIRLWPASFEQGTTLIPDFRAYDGMERDTKPGLEKNFVLEGWDCIGAYFSYRSNSYRVDFGAADYVAHNERPELYFNIDLQRKFIGPFVSDLMPMLVVAVLLFAILMIQTRRDESGLLGFSASTVLSYCSGLFFVLIISHVYVREKLAVPQIIYIEWFYFTMYALLLLLSLNAVQFARGRHMKLFGLDDTEWITLAYWPIALGILFLMTLWTFF